MKKFRLTIAKKKTIYRMTKIKTQLSELLVNPLAMQAPKYEAILQRNMICEHRGFGKVLLIAVLVFRQGQKRGKESVTSI